MRGWGLGWEAQSKRLHVVSDDLEVTHIIYAHPISPASDIQPYPLQGKLQPPVKAMVAMWHKSGLSPGQLSSSSKAPGERVFSSVPWSPCLKHTHNAWSNHLVNTKTGEDGSRVWGTEDTAEPAAQPCAACLQASG